MKTLPFRKIADVKNTPGLHLQGAYLFRVRIEGHAHVEQVASLLNT